MYNLFKGVLDLLVEGGVIEDDRFIYKLQGEKVQSKGEDIIEIEIKTP